MKWKAEFNQHFFFFTGNYIFQENLIAISGFPRAQATFYITTNFFFFFRWTNEDANGSSGAAALPPQGLSWGRPWRYRELDPVLAGHVHQQVPGPRHQRRKYLILSLEGFKPNLTKEGGCNAHFNGKSSHFGVYFTYTTSNFEA